MPELTFDGVKFDVLRDGDRVWVGAELKNSYATHPPMARLTATECHKLAELLVREADAVKPYGKVE